MTVVGIDKIGFYTPGYVLDLVALAKARGDEPDKYTIGIGQDYQAVIPPNEDIVTMGANAAKQIINDQDRQKIDMVIVATESGIDNSKSSAMYIQRLLGLSEFSRTIEMKQACYAGTYGLMQARDYVTLHPEKRVLVIAADIARYGLATPGEVTQGGGAVAMIVAANPKILSINHDSVYMSHDVMDFWRPLDRSEAIVDGHLSTDVYKEMFMTLWQRYVQQNHKSIDELSAFVFHLPYTKMGKKALLQILPQATEQQQSLLMNHLQESQRFSRQVGNLYTGSVYLSLLSLLCHASDLQSGDDIAVFSYGSGAEAELYSVTLQPNFEEYVPKTLLHDLLEKRQVVSVATYEDIFKQQLTRSQIDTTTAMRSTGYNLLGIQDGMRIYE